jgi:hypothetical protein
MKLKLPEDRVWQDDFLNDPSKNLALFLWKCLFGKRGRAGTVFLKKVVEK